MTRDGVSQYRWVVLALMTLAHALGSAAALAAAPLTPFLLDALALTRAQVGLLLPAVYLGGVLVSLPGGVLTERFGVRPPLILALALTAAAMALATLAGTFGALLALSVVAGLGFGFLNPTTGKAIHDWFPARERGLAMGVKQAGLTGGGIASALALPPVAAALGWRAAVFAGAGAALVAAVLVGLLHREVRPPAAGAPAGAGLAGLVPLLRRPGVRVVLGCGLALGVVQSSVLAYLVLYARETYAFSAVEAARALALAHLGGVIGRLGWGAASDRFFGGRRRPGLAINAAIAALAFAAFAGGSLVPAWLAGTVAVVAGAGAFGWVGLYFALMAEIGGARHAGLVTGLGVVFAWGGVLIGPPLFGLAVDATGAYRVPWLVLAALSLAVALVLPRLRPLVDRH